MGPQNTDFGLSAQTRKPKTVRAFSNPSGGLSSMLHSDWLSYYLAICCSPQIEKSAGIENQNNGG